MERRRPQVGAIAGSGRITASGSLGGVVPIIAAVQRRHGASATLTVKLLLQQNPARRRRRRADGPAGRDDARRQRRLGVPVRRDGLGARASAADAAVERRRRDRRLLRAHREPDVRAPAVHDARRGRRARSSRSTPTTWGQLTELDRRARRAHGRALERHGRHRDRERRAGPSRRPRCAEHHLLLVEQPRPRPAHPARRRGARRLRQPGRRSDDPTQSSRTAA